MIAAAPRGPVSICLTVPLIIGFLVSLGICAYHVYEANEDRRSELVAAYDSSVEAWTAGDAETYAEKWTGEAALPLPSLTVDRDDPNHVDGTFTFGVFQSGDEALGALRDAEPDYLRYDRGTVLQTTIENFFDDSRRVGVEDVRFVVGNTTVYAEAIACRVDEYCDGAESADNPNSGSSGQTCETRYQAGVAFLQSVTLVESLGGGTHVPRRRGESERVRLRVHVLHLRRGSFSSRAAGAGHVRFRSSQLFVGSDRVARRARHGRSPRRPVRQGHGADARARERHERVQRRLRDERRGAEANRDRIGRRRGRAGGVGGDRDRVRVAIVEKRPGREERAAESPDAPDGVCGSATPRGVRRTAQHPAADAAARRHAGTPAPRGVREYPSLPRGVRKCPNTQACGDADTRAPSEVTHDRGVPRRARGCFRSFRTSRGMRDVSVVVVT